MFAYIRGVWYIFFVNGEGTKTDFTPYVSTLRNAAGVIQRNRAAMPVQWREAVF